MALAERLRISPGVPLLLAAFVWLASPLLLGAILSAAVCHELGHWLVLRRVGGRIQRLHITVFGAEMQVDDRRISYGGELLTAAAGPVINLLLAAAMVFFRDTQFLWGVVSMLWMYATPIFYPESIIPERFMLIYKMNPLYHIIRFIRTILINGVSPEPKAYVLALIASVVPLIIGITVFKRTQDRFVLNI